MIVNTLCFASFLEQANEAYGAGRFGEAVLYYKKAAAGGENPSLCYFNMANACFQLDSIPRAIVYYLSCVAGAPDFFRGYLNLGIAYFTLDDAGQSIAALTRALSIEPDNVKASLVLAAAYRKAGGVKESAALFEKIVEKYPETEDAWIALGEMYRELNDPEDAARLLSRYPAGGKNQAYVQLLLADIAEDRRDYQSAIYYLRKSFELDSSKRWIYYRMVSLYRETGSLHVALQEARSGLAIFPDFADLALLAGNCAFDLELYEQAEHFYADAGKMGSAGAIVGLENIRSVQQRQAQ
jgi:tetratricopeptide (TPR) repeat protein